MSAAMQAQQIQKVYSEWCVKAAEIILASRVDDPGIVKAPMQASASFGLRVPELFEVRREAVSRPEFFQLKTQRSFQVEIYLGDPTEGEADQDQSQLLERWTFTFFPAQCEPTAPDRHNQILVRKLSVTLRSLLCFTRLLPAYAFCRSAPGAPRRHWRFRVEAWPPTARTTQTQELATQAFVTLQSSVGQLRLSVSQRKDLRDPSSGSAVFQGTTIVASQTDQLEVREGYFPSSSSHGTVADAAASVRRLDKIAEEPEARHGNGNVMRRASEPPGALGGAWQPSGLSFAPSVVHEQASKRTGGITRQRVGSADSAGSSKSASRPTSARSAPDPGKMHPGTPPLPATAWPSTGGSPMVITLGPTSRGGSACSSRSQTPHATPNLGPAPDPASPGAASGGALADQRGSRPPTPGLLGAASGSRAGSPGASAAGNVTASMASAVEQQFGASSQLGVGEPGLAEPVPLAPGRRAGSPGASAASMPGLAGAAGGLEDLLMRYPTDWHRHSRSISSRTASQGTGSRSLSPEDAPRGSAASASRSPGLGYAVPPGGEAEADIVMFGMSDDEDNSNPISQDTAQRQAASSWGHARHHQGPGQSSVRMEPAPDDARDLDSTDPVSRPCSAGHPQHQPPVSRHPSSGDIHPAPVPTRHLSPLIAQLNPFTPPPEFSLPPAGTEMSCASSDLGGASGLMPDAAGEVEGQQLLVELQQLVSNLSQHRAMAITAQELPAEELLERLEHFREVAGGLGIELGSAPAEQQNCGT